MTLSSLISGAAWTLCRLLPVKKNKVVFSHFYGKGFGDSPKAIALALRDAAPGADIVWLISDPSVALPEGIRPASYAPLSRIYHLSTARVWVDDCRKGARYKKKGQFYLQTWHGFALKQIEQDAAATLPADYPAYAMRDSRQTDLMVSGSRFMADRYRHAFWYSGEVAEYGSPRNDILFEPPDGLREKVCVALGISPKKKLILYAPTFRVDGSLSAYSIDIPGVISACDQRFGGDHVMLLRLHPNIAASASQLSCNGNTAVQATNYPDIQELLAVADVVITDYSSVMFDFALTRRPVFQFATDIAAYQKDRSFYFPLDQLPFPLAESNDALLCAISAYDEDAASSRWSKFAKENGIHEDGRAASRCASWIQAHL